MIIQFVNSPLLAVSWLVIVALMIWGGRPERWGGAVFAGLILVTPFIYTLEWQGLRWGVAMTSVAVFVALLWLAVSRDRWWLVAAAGFHLLALSTHLLALLRVDQLMWTAVTLRWISWVAVLAAALFGLWEGRALDRIVKQSRLAA